MTVEPARLIVCPHCGGPLTAPSAGGAVACSFCGVTSTVGARPPLRAATGLLPDPAAPTERARLQQLREVARTFTTTQDRYSMDLEPDGFADIDGFDHSRETAKRLERAFAERLAGAARAALSPADERTLWWIATRLVNLWRTRNDIVRANAVAGAASEVIADPRLRQGFYLTLAAYARKEGEWDAAETWLAQCDPAPTELALESDYRSSVGIYYLAREQWADALAAVGALASARPWSSEDAPVVFATRSSAHDRLGHPATADEDLLEGIDYLVEQTVAHNAELARDNPAEVRALARDSAVQWYANLIDDSTVFAPCRDAWARLADRGQLPDHKAAVKAFRAAHGD